MSIQPIDVSLAIIPDGHSPKAAAYKVKSSFEKFAAKPENGEIAVDLTVTVFSLDVDPATLPVLSNLSQYDVAEVDLCMLETLADKPDVLPTEVTGGRVWLPAVQQAVEKISNFLPQWVQASFLINWRGDAGLELATSFDKLCSTLDPDIGRSIFADLWGKAALGQAYVDAMVDLNGLDTTINHLRALAANESQQLDPAAALVLWRLSKKVKNEFLKNRSRLHVNPVAYARGFAVSKGSCTYSPLSIVGEIERYAAEEPWRVTRSAVTDSQQPFNRREIIIRQMPFGNSSNGIPLRTTGFVVPKGKLTLTPERQKVITLLLKYLGSESGYQCFLKPEETLPATYQIPADASIFSSTLVKTQAPLFVDLFKAPDDPADATDPDNVNDPANLLADAFVISVFEHQKGLFRAGLLLEELLLPAYI